MLDLPLPALTFPSMTYGEKEVPRDLRRWVYRGGAGAVARTVMARIEGGEFGRPLVERIELVRLVHEVLLNYFERGGRRRTVLSAIERLALFFIWADAEAHELTLDTIEESYRHWTDSLLHRARVGKELSERTAYQSGSVVGSVLDRVLGRGVPLVKTTRLRSPKKGLRAVGAHSDKQNLEDTFALGHFLLDLADGLNVDAIWGPLPVRIRVRNGIVLEEWSGLKRSDTLKPPNPKYPRSVARDAKNSAEKRARWEADTTFRTRYPLINLRIQAEMFMLMGQPAINLAQAHQLRMDQWRYKASTHGYEVRTYKHRRMGPVVFEIYSQYREVFERYLRWRTAIFPDDPDGLLFPLLGKAGAQVARHADKAPYFDSLKDACLRAGVTYLPPSALRSTNVNWMLRRTQDPDLTADEKQHATKTLLGTYEKPSLQRAMVQLKVFWAKHDPAHAAAGPGTCIGKVPEPITDKPVAATQPDCLTPAGCLFCTHQRDVDSFDHMWSLASFRLLKSFELRTQGLPVSRGVAAEHPAEAVIARITAKLSHMSSSSSQRSKWIEEAQLRIEEGRYHPSWSDMIESA